MMKTVTEIEETVELFIVMIAEMAEIETNEVINADSIRGADLFKVQDDALESYTVDDIVIVFELKETQDVDVVYQEDEGDMISIGSYQLDIVMYGNNSRTVAKKLIARLQSQHSKNRLNETGIELVEISKVEPTSELINTIRHIRRDFTIDFNCALRIVPTEQFEEIETIDTDVSNL